MYKKPGYIGNPTIIALVRELRAAGMPRRDVIAYVHHIWIEHNSDRRYADHTYRVAPRYNESYALCDNDDMNVDSSILRREMQGRYNDIDDVMGRCGTYHIPGVGSVYDERLIQLLQQLTTEERMILVMYYVYNYTQRDIGLIIGRSESAIYRKIKKIKELANNT